MIPLSDKIDSKMRENKFVDHVYNRIHLTTPPKNWMNFVFFKININSNIKDNIRDSLK